jgi:hypothetical protein
MNESGYLRPMLQPGQTLLHPAGTFFISIVYLLSAGLPACHTPKAQNCLSPTGDDSVRVILIKDIHHTLASIKGLPKEDGIFINQQKFVFFAPLCYEYLFPARKILLNLH